MQWDADAKVIGDRLFDLNSIDSLYNDLIVSSRNTPYIIILLLKYNKIRLSCLSVMIFALVS